MKTITLETLKSIEYFKNEKIGILFNDKDSAERVIQWYSPDYFEYKYRLSNNGMYLMIFTTSWITGEDMFLTYDLDAEFKYIDDNTYSMELTEDTILDWINNEHDVDSLVLFK